MAGVGLRAGREGGQRVEELEGHGEGRAGLRRRLAAQRPVGGGHVQRERRRGELQGEGRVVPEGEAEGPAGRSMCMER